MMEELQAVIEAANASKHDLHIGEAMQDLLAARVGAVLYSKWSHLAETEEVWDLAKAAYLQGVQDGPSWKATVEGLRNLVG